MGVFDFLQGNLVPSVALIFFILYLLYTLVTKKGKKINLGPGGISIENDSKEQQIEKPAEQIGTEDPLKKEYDAKMIQVVISLSSYLTNRQQREYEKIKAVRDLTLVNQLDYVDQKFLVYKAELESNFYAFGEQKDLPQMFSMMVFEDIYDRSRKKIVDVIKKNHLAQLTEFSLQEKVNNEAKIAVDFFKQRIDKLPINFDKEKFIKVYSEAINEITKASIVNAKSLAIERNTQIKKIQEQYRTETVDYIDSVLKKNGVKVIEDEIKNIINKNLDFVSDFD